ncbi:MAG: alkaline phosphatase [Clostridia bacterium]|nr:alkaline phosphatase [Clostridia bacterium]
MKSKISLLLIIVILLSSLVVLSSCTRYMKQPTINGIKLSKYVIVYDEQGLDYNKRAAEYIQSTAKARYGVNLKIVDDNDDKSANEIVVGETSRPISERLNVETEGVEFSILAKEGSVALEGDYFVIAAAAYYFMETFALTDAQVSNVPEQAEVHQPIVKEAKNYILLIGDGMGVYQTKIFDYMDKKSDLSDGEGIFFGYMFPYIGESRTESLSGITDSAAGGTALACGIKTYNKYLGLDENKNHVKSLTELAYELGMSAGVMSTETESGATPSAFAVHIEDRDQSSEILKAHMEATQKYGTIIDCGYDYTTASRLSVMESHIEKTLASLSANENGFFLMYEEAYIDKKCHNNNLNDVYNMVARFNQAIGRFMEFAFYNPNTFVLITADHETGRLLPNENGVLQFNDDDHSEANVPIFAYGHGAELFDGVNIENIQIAHTIAALMGEENFGDQSEFQSLTKNSK